MARASDDRRPATTRRSSEDALQEILADARRGTADAAPRAGVTFADPAAEFLRYIEQDRP